MQQTSKYQLNLIEGSDDFLPDALNENMEKLEEALNQEAELREDVAETLVALAANVGTAGKTARIVWGSYTGTGTYGASAPTVFSCDFYPLVLFVQHAGFQMSDPLFLVHGATSYTAYQTGSAIWDNRAVKIYSNEAPDTQYNYSGAVYQYVILGYDNA